MLLKSLKFKIWVLLRRGELRPPRSPGHRQIPDHHFPHRQCPGPGQAGALRGREDGRSGGGPEASGRHWHRPLLSGAPLQQIQEEGCSGTASAGLRGHPDPDCCGIRPKGRSNRRHALGAGCLCPAAAPPAALRQHPVCIVVVL